MTVSSPFDQPAGATWKGNILATSSSDAYPSGHLGQRTSIANFPQ